MMKHPKTLLCFAVLFILLASCAGAASSLSDIASPFPWEAEQTGDPAEGQYLSYSEGLDENGFWEGVRALDYVEMFEYLAIPVPSDIHTVTDEAVDNGINSMLAYYTTSEQVTDRPVADGDTVNIDYVGSVDGIKFDGGSTDGAGSDVTIGVTNFIDDFLQQLIGHTPGETVNVEVTFPDDYHEESLQGRDALFVTDINYITEDVVPELNDAFAAETLSEIYGWNTAEEARDGIRADLRKTALEQFIQTYFTTEVTVHSVPESVLTYHENAMLEYFESIAASYGIGLEEFITAQGLSGVDELLATSKENNTNTATYHLVIQAIAEDAGIMVGETDLTEYFAEYGESEDYSAVEKDFGLPYLKQVVLTQKIMDFIVSVKAAPT